MLCVHGGFDFARPLADWALPESFGVLRRRLEADDRIRAAERKADPAAFKAKYGTNRSKRNAFGKCVASKVSEDEETDA